MAEHVPDSHLTKRSVTVSRPRIPFGWRYMGQDVIIWSAVCSSAPHSLDAVEAMPHLCIDDRKRPIPVRRRFSRTQASLGIPIPGGRASTSPKNECRQEVPSRHSMLQLWSVHLAALVSSLLASLSSSRAAGTKGCLDISCRCPPQGWDVNRSRSRWPGSWARHAKDSMALLRRSSVGVMSDITNRLSVSVARRHPVTRRKASLMGLSMRHM